MSVLVFLEFNNNELKETSKQALTYANGINKNVYAISESKISNDVVESLGKFGVSIYLINAVDFKENNILKCIIPTIEEFKINCIIFPKTNSFSYLSSILSTKLNFPLINNVNSVARFENKICLKSTIFSGKAEADIEIDSNSCILVLNKNIINSASYKKSVIIKNLINKNDNSLSNNVVSLKKEKLEGDILLNDADIVVSAGRGLKGPENWKMIEKLAKILNAGTACSKPVSDAGWRPHHEHVGQTGLKISPNIYIAVGISGAIQHLAGVNSSKIIVVINNDSEAPFFKHADYGIIGDAFDVIPKFIDALK
ncbi:MAG: electron transfer flavoprotein subunit alpha/FixB family protein [Bacteroidota bacterium]|uniref:Electron transfer flavoprotein alpha/beta-subunit N-terminal domain-containing protein n=1 Tax=marine metagenome TaxID=408172 RepID=A0A381PTH7_9ZZZZ|nr:electron transfer flavoprotein subunit alpha/FixB family protein [Bacteroidota bacterium]